MYRKLIGLAFAAVLLAACSKQEKPVLSCNSPSVLNDIRSNIQNTLKQDARSFARNDVRKFVDADKIIAAAYDLAFSLENPTEMQDGNQTFCLANLKIEMPSETLDEAAANSPLLYGDTALDELLRQKTADGSLEVNGNTLSAAVRYVPNPDGQTVFIDNTVSAAAQTLSAALLPYGVKSIVMIDGKAVSKEDAVKILNGKPHDEPPALTPEAILEENAAGSDPDLPPAEQPPTEILTPDDNETQDTVSVSHNDLEDAREQNHRAESEITRIWGSLETDVQKQLVAEQRKWAQEKISNCRQASAQTEDKQYAEYLKLQCDTRMTRERVQYLRGYSID